MGSHVQLNNSNTTPQYFEIPAFKKQYNNEMLVNVNLPNSEMVKNDEQSNFKTPVKKIEQFNLNDDLPSFAKPVNDNNFNSNTRVQNTMDHARLYTSHQPPSDKKMINSACRNRQSLRKICSNEKDEPIIDIDFFCTQLSQSIAVETIKITNK